MESFQISQICANDIELEKFWKKLKGKIWAISVGGEDANGSPQYGSCTGFAVSNSGLILTCSRSFFGRKDFKVRGCSLGVKNKKPKKLECVIINHKWGVAILRTRVAKDFQIAKLAKNGSLFPGQTLLVIGNSFGTCLGSFYTLRVSYPCIDKVSLGENENDTCGEYVNNNWLNDFQTHRSMGDMRYQGIDMTPSQKCSHPSVPIIQMGGGAIPPGSSGCPIFNLQGEVVGMMESGRDVTHFAIHVFALKKVLIKGEKAIKAWRLWSQSGSSMKYHARMGFQVKRSSLN